MKWLNVTTTINLNKPLWSRRSVTPPLPEHVVTTPDPRHDTRTGLPSRDFTATELDRRWCATIASCLLMAPGRARRRRRHTGEACTGAIAVKQSSQIRSCLVE